MNLNLNGSDAELTIIIYDATLFKKPFIEWTKMIPFQ